MNRTLRTGLLALALAAGQAAFLAAPGLANVPTALPLTGDLEAPGIRGTEGSASAGAVAVRENEAPAPRKTCPTRSWPNLAPRCVAALDLGGQR